MTWLLRMPSLHSGQLCNRVVEEACVNFVGQFCFLFCAVIHGLVCVCVSVYRFIWRSEDNLGCQSLSTSHLLLESGSVIGLDLTKQATPGHCNPRNPPVSTIHLTLSRVQRATLSPKEGDVVLKNNSQG